MSADAWIEWSALAEPGDEAAGWLIEILGVAQARAWVDRVAEDAVEATMLLAGGADERAIDEAVRASERWVRRRDVAKAPRLREQAQRCGARPVVRGDGEWPRALEDLGRAAPFALWARGGGSAAALGERSVALVGARSASAYGTHMASTLAAHLADAGWTVVSGGAYGIDAAAHGGALSAGGSAVAVMAGGVDRLYPAGNADLLGRVLDHGVVLSEVPPGWAPHRSRFLTRNRLIACAGATVVVEAAHRSGALSTARHAAALARPLGAVPGPATSATSTGCHDLIRDGMAVLVSDGRDVIELAGPLDLQAADDSGRGAMDGGSDFAHPHDRAVFDALGGRAKDVESLAGVAGLTRAEVRTALGRLDLAGRASRAGARWARA